jgi:hypothetical protein
MTGNKYWSSCEGRKKKSKYFTDIGFLKTEITKIKVLSYFALN